MADTHVWLVHTPIEIARAVEKASVVAIDWEQKLLASFLTSGRLPGHTWGSPTLRC